MQQSIHHIIEELPLKFIEKVKATDCVATLIKMKRGASPKKIAVLEARIANINYLVS